MVLVKYSGVGILVAFIVRDREKSGRQRCVHTNTTKAKKAERTRIPVQNYFISAKGAAKSMSSILRDTVVLIHQ